MNVAGFDCPEGLHYLIEHQVWARLGVGSEEGVATVGITALGIHQAGEIYMCRPKAEGQLIEQGRAVAVVELAKSIVSVKSPVSGMVLAVNPLLKDEPEWVHREPYGRGWLAQVRLSAWEQDQAALLHGAAVAEAMTRHAWLNGVIHTPPEAKP